MSERSQQQFPFHTKWHVWQVLISFNSTKNKIPLVCWWGEKRETRSRKKRLGVNSGMHLFLIWFDSCLICFYRNLDILSVSRYILEMSVGILFQSSSSMFSITPAYELERPDHWSFFPFDQKGTTKEGNSLIFLLVNRLTQFLRNICS